MCRRSAASSSSNVVVVVALVFAHAASAGKYMRSEKRLEVAQDRNLIRRAVRTEMNKLDVRSEEDLRLDKEFEKADPIAANNIGHSTPWPDYDPCVVLGCNETVDNCTFLVGGDWQKGAAVTKLGSKKRCSGTMVKLGNKDGENGAAITDLVGCTTAVYNAFHAETPTCSQTFMQDYYDKSCTCLAPGGTCTQEDQGNHCLWDMIPSFTGHVTSQAVIPKNEAIVPDPTKNGKRCAGSKNSKNRVFTLKRSAATQEACEKACAADTTCIAFSGIFGAADPKKQWCFGCRVPLTKRVKRAPTNTVAYMKSKAQST